MNKVIAAHQPCYIPWLGYFYKISQSNIFVFADDSDFSSKGMHNYHYIKTSQGLVRLKIPIDYLRDSKAKIHEIRTKDELNWKRKHLLFIEHNYKRGKHFEEVFNDFRNLLIEKYPNLALMNQRIITFICQKLGINVQFVCSSSLGVSTSKEERIFDICRLLGGTVYYSGTGARVYQDEEHFKNNGIELRYSDFKPFKYYQPWGEFESNVSILDYLLEYGYDWGTVIANQKV
jgi:hypothetical protein